MSIATRNLKQKVTLWRVTTDATGGYTFAVPEIHNGRWEDRQMLFRDPTGDEKVSNAIVYLDTDVAPGDYLFLGESDEENPAVAHGLLAQRVKQFNSIPDLRSMVTIRKAFL